MDAAGERPDLSIALAAIFAGEVDFNSELQPGDRFRLSVEKSTREGMFAGYGPIAIAELENAGHRYRAIRFTPPDGEPGYYDEQGRSLRRFFLKSPLKFEPRVTSRFSSSRLHPILHERRAHLGVDFGAPAGAPVLAVAHGVVVSAGMDGNSGRMVHLRHTGGYETMYLHLSSIPKEVRPGARVQQGDSIGRVGSTGLATAPHLDYRLRKNGVYVNPLAEHKLMPPGEPIAAVHLASFEAERDRMIAQLDPPLPAVALAGGR
jgi:murein DD-endopeptidase MepM/ murein hydrolase activator NlpD